ncbi:MAG: hypothetical protein A2X67_08265 [Ignavibacteria bacterium GWA2_55_11]|nr:MAG: hypothetical protein A2X67_08265 [Ignavibacteria bacterium GWA2_55_11]OGU65085.1 MAG: hypothetical protein A3C56_04695 [Ignavibacteria bacterium RIFCSPHIGHO2_02_FULL_56_12]OGU69429.1 MAG: hypothetical protein A3H45_10160 [Ignavibacteria bacterium RIFCSPLOWO2_02_FULL_55_14]OGU75423.1 MAG: hypothetical protein A3G43_03065 [Ignavibacteria bacterium RIFCSPLOWO2_12_FULL_56_21]
MMRTNRLSLYAVMGTFLMISGCSTSYRVQVIDGLPQEVYLTYPKGANMHVGDLFILYEVHQMQPNSDAQDHDGHSGHSRGTPSTMRMERALVEVVRIVDEERALVRVLTGEAKEGFEAVRRR